MDADFVSQLLGANVDQDDPLVQAALAQLGAARPPSEGGAAEEEKSKKRKGNDGM